MTGVNSQEWKPWPPSDWPAWPEWPPYGYAQPLSTEISPVVYSPNAPQPAEVPKEINIAESPQPKGKGKGKGKKKGKGKNLLTPSPKILPISSSVNTEPIPSPPPSQQPTNVSPPPSPSTATPPSPPPSPVANEGVQDLNGEAFLARPSVPRNATGVLPGVIPQLQVGGLTRPRQTSSGFTDLIAAASAREDLSTLVTALSTVSLRTVIENDEFTGTLFAPTNAAFELALSTLGLDLTDLLQDIDKLRIILQYHITPTAFFEEQLNGLQLNTFLDGSTLTIERQEGAVKISGVASQANIVLADIVAGNGIFHIVDAVLLPFAV